MSDAPPTVNTVYMIVGMHRSGTSSIGQLMESIGFDFGNNLLEGVDSINDRGFWEDRDVVALDEHIFELYGSSWFDFERLPGKWWEDAKIRDLVGVAETWFQEGFSHEKPIAVKDPRFCRLLPFWKRVFLGLGIRPHIIFVIRHPAEVAASLKRRDGFSLQVGYLLWLSYIIDGLYYSRNLDLAIIDFESMLANPKKVSARLAETDIASLHGLAEHDILELVTKTLDVESRHQKHHEVLLTGEVQGDVQSMAHELYEVLLNSTPDEAKSIADKYRKRFYRMLDHHKEVLSALQATVKKQVETNQKLTEIGSGHTYALSVIQDKDKQLEENKDFIAKCLAEIGNKESQLALTQQELERNQARIGEQETLNQKNVELWDRFEELQQVVHGRELKLSESLAYIEKCEAWIGELNLLSEDCQRILAEQRDYIARCESRIKEQDQWLSENTAYIAKCEARIKEQDFGLAENRDYIVRCEARIREQDNGLQIRDQMLGERLEKINRLEMGLKEIEDVLAQKQIEFSENCDAVVQSRSRVEILDKKLQEQQELLNTNRNYIRQCEEYIAEQDRALDEQGTRISEQNELLLLKQQEVVDCRNHIAELERKSTEQSKELLNKNDIIVQQNAAFANLERKSTEQSKELLNKNDIIVQQNAVFAKGAEELKNYQSRIDTLDQQVADLVQIKNRHESEIASHLSAISANHKHSQQLEADIKSLQTNKESLNAEITRLQQLDILNKQRMALQKKQIDTTKTHVAALESEIIALNAQLASKQQEIERYRSYRIVKLIDKFTETD